jgi:hypothetical protein
MRLLLAVVSLPVKLTLEIASRAASAVGLGGDDGDSGITAERVPAQPEAFRAPAPPRPSGGNGGAPPAVPEPAHVSEEPELVAEVAERGAEQGAGPEVHVEEPWPGYNRMTAADIKARLHAAPKSLAAAVSLYEASRKGRSSVLQAATRAMGGST